MPRRSATLAPMRVSLPKLLRRSCLFVAAALMTLSTGGAAQASCADPPGPGVNWQRCNLDGLNVKDIDLSGAKLIDVSFFRADLSGSNLTESDAYRAKFVSAKLVGTNFEQARVFQADFSRADLSGASFSGADMRRARLYKANLRGADLTGARMFDADLTRADLSGATWTDGKRVCAEGSIGRCL